MNRLECMRDALSRVDIPMGILHGDPFLDNVLICEDSGEFRGFVDFEDVCVGPVLFDVACFVAGNCFDEYNKLVLSSCDAFLEGYTSSGTAEGKSKGRMITDLELDMLLPFLKHVLLCNACWRFVNFNISYPEQREELGEKYMELQQRLEYLERAEVSADIERLLQRFR